MSRTPSPAPSRATRHAFGRIVGLCLGLSVGLSPGLTATPAQAFDSFAASQGLWRASEGSEDGTIWTVELAGIGPFALLGLHQMTGSCGGLLILPGPEAYPLTDTVDLKFRPDTLSHGQGGIFDSQGEMDASHPCWPLRDAQVSLEPASDADTAPVLHVIRGDAHSRVALEQVSRFVSDDEMTPPAQDVLGVRLGMSVEEADTLLQGRGYGAVRSVTQAFQPGPGVHLSGAGAWLADVTAARRDAQLDVPQARHVIFSKTAIAETEDISARLAAGEDIVVLMEVDGTVAVVGRQVGIDPDARNDILAALQDKYPVAETRLDDRGGAFLRARLDRRAEVITGEALQGLRRDYQRRDRPFVACMGANPFRMDASQHEVADAYVSLWVRDPGEFPCASELAHALLWTPSGFHSQSVPHMQTVIHGLYGYAPSDFPAFRALAEPLLAEAWERFDRGEAPPDKVPDL